MDNRFKLNFHIFDDGGEGAGASFAEFEQGDEQQPQVVYGKEPEGNNQQSQVGADKTPEEEFAELIGKGGKYHDIYSQHFSQAINERFKNQQDAQDQVNWITDNLSIMFARYGLEPGDYEGLNDAMSHDDALYQAAADEEGLTLEQYKHMLQLEADAERGRLIQAQIEEAQRYNQQMAQWEAEAAELQQVFPAFDLGLEMQHNQQFAEYLNMGIGVGDAFYLAHKADIMSGQNDAVERQAAQKVVTTINQRQSRPAEGAMSSGPAVIRKSVPSKLTKEDWDELDRIVSAGGTVSF